MKNSLVALVCLFATGATAWAQSPMPLETPYYPLKVGNRWTYLASDKDTADGKPRLVTIEVDRPEIYEHVTGKDKQGNDLKEKFGGFLLKSTSDSKTTYDHVVVMKEGVRRVSISDSPKAAAMQITPPVLFFKLPLTPEESWDVNSTSRDTVIKGTFSWKREDVSVPFRKEPFKDAIMISFKAGLRAEINYWFVEGIGMVKQRVKTKNNEMVLELQSFKEAK